MILKNKNLLVIKRKYLIFLNLMIKTINYSKLIKKYNIFLFLLIERKTWFICLLNFNCLKLNNGYIIKKKKFLKT